MIKEDGSICFALELMDTVDAFLSEYQAIRGPFSGALERCLAISYVFGVMRSNIDAIWGRLTEEDIFPADPRQSFKECVAESESGAASLRAVVEEELHRRGWLPDGDPA